MKTDVSAPARSAFGASRKGSQRRGISLLALSLLLALASPAWALDLDGVMALLAQRKSGEARFSEERIVSGLDGPLQSKGTLSFAAPDRFSRSTDGPRGEVMEVQGNQLTLRRGGRTRQLALDTLPELAAMVAAVRGTLSGDASALKRYFRISTSGNADKWVLELQPLDSRLRNQVRSIEIVGQGPDLRSIDLQLAGGDRSLMQIQPLTVASARPGNPP
jgi:outer membrane lipoprotein-sorting protein